MERAARRNIEARGFEAYLPLRAAIGREKLRHKDRPLFSRYLFARFSPNDPRWVLVRDCPCVYMLIHEAGRLAPVPDSVVEAIRAREVGGLIHLEARRPPIPFEAGEPVQVHMAGRLVDAIFQEPLDDKRAVLLLRLLGTPRATVPLSDIRKA